MSDGLHFALVMASPIGMMVFLAYVVFVHSKRRWPGTRPWERTVAILTLDGRWMRERDRIARVQQFDGTGAAP